MSVEKLHVKRLLILSACAAMLLAGCGSTSDSAPDDKNGEAWSFTSAIAKQKASFEAAQTAFAAAVKAKPDLSVLAVSPDTDLLYVANPATAPELKDFQEWGLDVITPAKVDPDFTYWENLSWENADKYQPDLLLLDDRSYPNNLDLARKQPTWKSIKAAAAKSYAEWPAYWMHTYGEYADQLTKLMAAVEKPDPNLT